MEEMMPRAEPNFNAPIEADFIVSLKAKNGDYALFVEAFARRNGKAYLRHTADVREAARFSRFRADDVAGQVEEYRCTGRVERVSRDGLEREVVTREPAVDESTSLQRVALASQDGADRAEVFADREAAEDTPRLDNGGQPVIKEDTADPRAGSSVGANVAIAGNHIMTTVLDRLDLMETRLIAAFEQMIIRTKQ
jgi:hypothetical protein